MAKAKKKREQRVRHRGKLLALVLTALVSLFVFVTYLCQPEAEYVQSQVLDCSEGMLDTAVNNLLSDFGNSEALVNRFDEIHNARVEATGIYMDALPADTAPNLKQLAEESGAYDVYQVNAAGEILQSGLGQPLTLQSGAQTIRTMFETYGAFTEEDCRYYPLRCSRGNFVLAFTSSTLDRQIDPDEQVYAQLGEKAAETDTEVIAINLSTGIILSQNDSLNMTSVTDTDIDPEQMASGGPDFRQIGNRICYCVPRKLSDGYLLIAVTSVWSALMQGASAIAVPTFTFLLVMAAVLLYAFILIYDKKLAEEGMTYTKLLPQVYLNKTHLFKILPIALVGLLFFCATAAYVQTLRTMAQQAYSALGNLDYLTEKLENNEKELDGEEEKFDQDCIEQAHLAAWMLESNPLLLGDTYMEKLALAFKTDGIYVFNGAGRVEATSTGYRNYALSTDPEDPSYAFWSILKGDADDVVKDVPKVSFAEETETAPTAFSSVHDRQACLAGTRRREAAGIIRLTFPTQATDEKLSELGMETTLMQENVGPSSALMVADAQTHEIEYWNGGVLSPPLPAAIVGMSEGAFQNKYVGMQRIEEKNYYVAAVQYGDSIIFETVEAEYMMRNFSSVFGTICVGSALALLLLIFITALHFGAVPEKLPGTGRSNPMIHVTLPGGKTKTVSALKNRWSGTADKWAERTPEQKYVRVLGTLAAIAVFFIAFSAYMMNTSVESRAISAIIRGQWLRGFNIFSITTVIMIFAVVLVGSWVVRKLVLQVGRSLGPHSETICRLLSSTIKYAALIGTTFYCLNYLGIETKTLLASAGLLTAVIGIGAQSLFKDILAGISIVFEGEFRVGDIITIGDWRGTVLEIGLRTTKVEDTFKNVKVFNNAAITDVINMTQKYSYALCEVSVEYSESLERIENVLEDEFPKIRARQPLMVGDPIYRGVLRLGDSGVVIGVMALCLEEDRIVLSRALNRDIKLIFDAHHINVPFPQVVVNQPKAATGPVMTPAQKRRARRFADQQNRLASIAPGDVVGEEADAGQAEGQEAAGAVESGDATE